MLAWAARMTVAKSTVPRVQPSFEVDLDRYHPIDYEKIIPALKEIEQRLRSVPADKRGMRWIHESDRVLFYGERVFPVPYEDFVTKVDIGHVGQFYRDSLGVTTKVVTRDELGRTIHQGVRVVALPQPNYTAFLGKEELDVYKLEKVEYSEDEQRVWMLTVHSPNGSAVCDDGYTSFARTADGTGTVVAFMACQNFPLPPLMAMAQLHRVPWLRNKVTEDAYRRFCNVMMQNVEDCYHGIPFDIGRPVR